MSGQAGRPADCRQDGAIAQKFLGKLEVAGPFEFAPDPRVRPTARTCAGPRKMVVHCKIRGTFGPEKSMRSLGDIARVATGKNPVRDHMAGIAQYA